MIRRTTRSTLFPYTTLFRSAKNLVLDIAYVGSRGRNLPARDVNLNQLSPDALAFARNNYSQPNTCSNLPLPTQPGDRKSTRLNSSHANISYAVFCLNTKAGP